MKCPDCKNHVCEECGNCNCSEWIKCSEKMPDKRNHDSVLTFEILEHIETKEKVKCINIEETESLHYDNETNEVWSDGGGENITHWMPLPEPPKDEE